MEDAQSSGPSPWRKVSLTLALALVPVVGSYVPMPGIDFPSLPSTLSSSPNMSLFALGVGPLFSGYLLVELVALLVPRLRELRHGFPNGRARLRRWAFAAAFVLAAFQSFSMATMLSAGPLRATGGDNATPLMVFSAIAATGVLVLAARAIDGLGLVNGIVALSLTSECADAWRRFSRATLPSEPRGSAIVLVLYALPVVATWAAIRRSEQGPTSDAPWLGGPLSSLRPVLLTGSVLTLPSILRPFHVPGAAAAAAWLPGPHYFDVFLALGFALTLLLSFLLQQPQRVVRVLNAVDQRDAPFTKDDVWTALRRALLPSLLLIVTLLLASALLQAHSLPDYVFSLAMLTALLLDGRQAFELHRNLPGLTCVWEERRPYAVPGLVAAAERAGIPLYASGLAQTSMLRAFGAFAAISLWSAPSQATGARQLLGELLLRANGTPPVVPAPPANDEDEDGPDAKG